MAASVRARVLCAAADLWLTQEDLDRAQALAEAGLALYQELGDTAGIAHALDSLALFSWGKSQYAVARSQLEEAKVLFQEVGDTWSRGACLTQLARIATAQGEYDRARALLEESRGLYSALGDQYRIGWVLYLLARVLFLSGSNLAGAQRLAEQSLALLRTMGDEWFAPYVLSLLGQLRLQQGEQARARELFEVSLATVKKTSGDPWATAEALIGLPRVAALQDEVEEAMLGTGRAWCTCTRWTTRSLSLPAWKDGLTWLRHRESQPGQSGSGEQPKPCAKPSVLPLRQLNVLTMNVRSPPYAPALMRTSLLPRGPKDEP